MKRNIMISLIIMMVLLCIHSSSALADDMTGEFSVSLKVGESLKIDHPNGIPYDASYFAYNFFTGDESIVSMNYTTNASSATITGVSPGKTEVTGYLAYTVATRIPHRTYSSVTKTYSTYYTTEYSKYDYNYRWNVTVTGDPKVSAPTARVLSYTGAEQSLVNAGSAVGGTMQYAIGDNAAMAPTSGWSTSVPTGNRATVYYVWYKVIGDNYYNDTAPACVTVNIQQATLTVTADAKSKTYGDADPALTYSVYGLVGSDMLTGSMTRAAGENAGTYDIIQGTLAASDNYRIAFTGAKLTINQRAVTVTAADQTVQQGRGIDTGLGQVSLSGQLSGHVLSAVTLAADTTNQATADGRITPSNARISDSGNVDVTGNYAISYVAGKLTVIATPTQAPTQAPVQPTATPTQAPTRAPVQPMATPTQAPTPAPVQPTATPTQTPTKAPTVTKVKISKCKISVKDQYYTGEVLRPEVTVKYGKKVLKEGTDYALSYKNNKEVGTATVTVSGMGKYTGKAKVTFEIRKKVAISKCKLSVKDQVYTGKALKPNVTVKNGKTVLKKGTDYTLSYKNNKAVGVATVTVKGKGGYTGSKALTFRINPKGTAFSKVTGGNKQIALKWKNTKNITGYEVEYSLESDYYGSTRVKINKAKTLTKTIKGLKANKKYYVRIRTYAVVRKKTFYSAWSKSKTVKTKGTAANGNVDIGETDFEIPVQLDEIPVVTDNSFDAGIVADEAVELPGA